jgi:nucleotide-binding universal stress UspA family protein
VIAGIISSGAKKKVLLPRAAFTSFRTALTGNRKYSDEEAIAMNSGQRCPLPRLAKILVATERSAFSEGAVREAISLAKKCSSGLSVMTVVETNPEYETIGAEFLEREEEEALQHLASLKAKALEQIGSCEAFLRRGDSPARLIVEEAAQQKSDMIVIGRRGRKGFEKVLLGSAVSKVISHAPCKVLVVPKAAIIGCNTILVATDGSENADRAVAEAIEIAKHCGGRLIVVSVIFSKEGKEKAETDTGAVVSAAQKAGVSIEALTPEGKPGETIAETAAGRGVDLIVLGTYGKTGLKKLLMGSTTEKVIGMAGCAVLVVK